MVQYFKPEAEYTILLFGCMNIERRWRLKMKWPHNTHDTHFSIHYITLYSFVWRLNYSHKNTIFFYCLVHLRFGYHIIKYRYALYTDWFGLPACTDQKNFVPKYFTIYMYIYYADILEIHVVFLRLYACFTINLFLFFYGRSGAI